jgi:septum formation protein
MNIVLASRSRQRKKILEDNGFNFKVDVSNFDENSVQIDDIKKLTLELAKKKGETVAKRNPDSIIISADTLVCFEGMQIGQQKNEKEARTTIKRLLGKTHEVFSGLYVINTTNGKKIQDSEISYVTLKNIPDEVLEDYIESGQYKGKAGAYNISDPEFSSFVEKIEGSKTNIEGLPIEKIKKMIEMVK